MSPAWGALAIALPSLLLAGCVATGSPAAAPGGAASPAGAGTAPSFPSFTAGSASPSLSPDASASPEASGATTGLTSANSSPSPSTLENATAGASLPIPGQGSGGMVHNPLIICIGPNMGPPCVPSDQVAIVFAAEGALTSESRAFIYSLTVSPTDSCPAGAPAVACDTSDTPVATVSFGRQSGGSLGTVYVYRLTTGTLEGVLLP